MTESSPTLFNRRLGAAVRTKRVMAGMSQEAVGNALCVTFQQVQKYERGVNRISVETLVNLAKILKTTPQALIDEALLNESQEHPVAAKDPNQRLRLEAAQRMASMPEARQKVAANVIKALAGEAA